MKLRFCAAALAAVIFGASAQAAEGISYTFIEADYLRIDPDDFGSTDAFRADGSVALGDSFYLLGEYTTDFDSDLFDLGVGYHFPIGGRVDWIVEGAYNHLEVEGTSLDFDGYRIGTGFRANLSNLVELGGQVSWRDLDNGIDGDLFFEGNALFKITQSFGFNVLAGVNDNGDLNYGAGVRLSF